MTLIETAPPSPPFQAKTKFGEGAQVVRDIRTMPMAMARIERAIAGKELVNAIKEFGKTTGQETVVDAAKEGYFTLDHPAFKIYRYRPDIKFTEAWDKNMWQAMHNFADSIGVKHERLLKMGGQTWGKAYMGGNRIETRFGGPETVMTHEIGHQLDYKYGLVEKFFGGDRQKSDFILERQITKAEREGNTGLAEKYRKQMTINREMRDLADLRFEGMETSEYYKKYVRKGTEKMANMVHAYVHAPEKFRAAAPTAYTEFKGFLNQHPELAGLDQIKPSLTLGSGGFVKRPPGEDFDVFPVYVSREFEGPLKSVMSDIPGKLYSTMMDLKGKTMGVIMYSPLIHNGVEWGRALPLMPGKIITFKAYFDGNVAKNNPEIMSQAIKEGLVPIGHRFFMQDITGILEDPTLQPGRSWTAKLAGGAVGMVSKEGGQAVKRGIDTAGDFWHNTLLWDRIADLQAGLALNFEKGFIEKGFDPVTATRMAAHEANRFAGTLPYESMSRLARNLANFEFFSRTFTFGNLGVMKDMLTGLPRDVAAQIERDAGTAAMWAAKSEVRKISLHAFALDIALMYGVNSALQNGLDSMKRDKSGGVIPAVLSGAALGAGVGSGLGGKVGTAAGAAVGAAVGYALSPKEMGQIEEEYIDRFDRMAKNLKDSPSDLLKPISLLSSLTPMSENELGKELRVHYDNEDSGTGIYVRVPTGKIGEEFYSWLTNPLKLAQQKEGTVSRPVFQIANNDKGFGRRVWNPDIPGFEGAARAVGNMAWNILSQQFPTDSITAAIDMAKGESDETSAYKVIGPFFGLTFSKGAPGGPEVGVMFEAERKHRGEVADVMPDVKKLIKHGKTEEAVEKMNDARFTPQEIKTTILYATNPRARLSPRRMMKFQQIAPPEERERMERMRERNQ